MFGGNQKTLFVSRSFETKKELLTQLGKDMRVFTRELSIFELTFRPGGKATFDAEALAIKAQMAHKEAPKSNGHQVCLNIRNVI